MKIYSGGRRSDSFEHALVKGRIGRRFEIGFLDKEVKACGNRRKEGLESLLGTSSQRSAIHFVRILIFSTFLGIVHLYPIGGWMPPPIDAFCHFGGIESAFTLIFAGKMIQRIAWSSFALLLATLIVAFIFRRSS